jgi:hypothetical protein
MVAGKVSTETVAARRSGEAENCRCCTGSVTEGGPPTWLLYGGVHVLIQVERPWYAEAGEWGVPNFGETLYTGTNGEIYPMFTMTKWGWWFAATVHGINLNIQTESKQWQPNDQRRKAHSSRAPVATHGASLPGLAASPHSYCWR